MLEIALTLLRSLTREISFGKDLEFGAIHTGSYCLCFEILITETGKSFSKVHLRIRFDLKRLSSLNLHITEVTLVV